VGELSSCVRGTTLGTSERGPSGAAVSQRLRRYPLLDRSLASRLTTLRAGAWPCTEDLNGTTFASELPKSYSRGWMREQAPRCFGCLQSLGLLSKMKGTSVENELNQHKLRFTHQTPFESTRPSSVGWWAPDEWGAEPTSPRVPNAASDENSRASNPCNTEPVVAPECSQASDR